MNREQRKSVFSPKSMEERRIQLDYWLKQLEKRGEGKIVGRKAEGGIYVNKPLTGRFESIPILYSQHIAWSRNTVQETTEHFPVYLLRSASFFPQ